MLTSWWCATFEREALPPCACQGTLGNARLKAVQRCRDPRELPRSRPTSCARLDRRYLNVATGDRRTPDLVWLLRDIFTDEPCSVLRVYLNDDGEVIGRRTLGRVYNSAVN